MHWREVRMLRREPGDPWYECLGVEPPHLGEIELVAVFPEVITDRLRFTREVVVFCKAVLDRRAMHATTGEVAVVRGDRFLDDRPDDMGGENAVAGRSGRLGKIGFGHWVGFTA
ncbi:hypothetical protein [Halomarina rubra]|uniref:Uncharacterized protein n=1 Tax=Halomarina rubra TaxID=2071873 RepID=A0ABD6AYV8_9EURY|nr:hypothetical protein [Halomarina rubra]